MVEVGWESLARMGYRYKGGDGALESDSSTVINSWRTLSVENEGLGLAFLHLGSCYCLGRRCARRSSVASLILQVGWRGVAGFVVVA